MPKRRRRERVTLAPSAPEPGPALRALLRRHPKGARPSLALRGSMAAHLFAVRRAGASVPAAIRRLKLHPAQVYRWAEVRKILTLDPIATVRATVHPNGPDAVSGTVSLDLDWAAAVNARITTVEQAIAALEEDATAPTRLKAEMTVEMSIPGSDGTSGSLTIRSTDPAQIRAFIQTLGAARGS